MTATTKTYFEPGTEVTVTVTGRVVHHNGGGLVIEHLRGGFANRIVVDTDADAVTAVVANPPTQDELAARERAARLIAISGGQEDPDWAPRVGAEFVARFNDAYPVGTPVRLWTGVVSVTTSPARVHANWPVAVAVVAVEGVVELVALTSVTPLAALTAD